MRCWFCLPAILLAVFCCVSEAQETVPANLLDLLNGPDRTDIPNKIDIRHPMLMFQQNYLVRVDGTFPSKIIRRGELRHLQILTKVQDSDGRWLNGGDFDDFKVPEKVGKQSLYYSAAIYLRPGRYRLGIVMFDAESHKADVLHRDIVIEPMKNDPFPQVDAALPPVEFPDRLDGHRGFWNVGDQLKPIAIDPGKHARLDVVLNITKRFRWDVLYRMDVQTMLESGSVLGRLRPADGCVRVSVIDALRLKVVVDRFPAERLSWARLQNAIEKIDQNVIDVKVLANQQRVAEFTHDFLQQLAADKQPCPGQDGPVSPTVVVVSPDLILPNGNKLSTLSPLERNLYIYVHVGFGNGWTDGIGQILSSGKPRRMNGTSPENFREALAKIATLISQPSQSDRD